MAQNNHVSAEDSLTIPVQATQSSDSEHGDSGESGNIPLHTLCSLPRHALLAEMNRLYLHLKAQMENFTNACIADQDELQTLAALVDALESCGVLMSVMIAKREARIREMEMTSYDGTLVWRIDDVWRKRQEAISGEVPSMCSPVFHTDRYGYKMAVRVFLNGDCEAKGSHISVFFTMMKGEYDALLSWPFRQKVTLILLDQNNREHVIDAFRPDPTSSSFRRPQSHVNTASRVPLFCSLSKVYSPDYGYIKEDVMFLKIVVDHVKEE